MPTAKFWLKVMLWALGVGAAVGVLAVLTHADRVVYQAMGSAFLVAGAALLMIGDARLIDRQATRYAGILGMWLITAEFLLILMLIWEVDRLFVSGYLYDDHLFATCWWLLLTGVPAMVFLRLMQTQSNRLAGWTGLGLACVTLVLLMIGTLIPSGQAHGWGISATQERLLATGMSVGLVGLLAVGCLIGAARVSRIGWRWVGIAAAAVGLGLILAEVWRGTHEEFLKAVVCLLSVGALTMHVNVLLLTPLKDRHKWLAYATAGASAFTFLMIDLVVIYELFEGFDTFPERLAAAGVIVTVCATLATAVLSRLARPVAIERGSEQVRQVSVICPVCRKKQTLEAGTPTACKTCHLRIEVKVSEPRCPSCDYLLYYTQSPTCPECGHVL